MVSILFFDHIIPFSFLPKLPKDLFDKKYRIKPLVDDVLDLQPAADKLDLPPFLFKNRLFVQIWLFTPIFLIDLYLRPAADAHVQGQRLFEVEIGIFAVPAFFCSH